MSTPSIHVNNEVITIVGSSEKLIALAEAILLKARFPEMTTVQMNDGEAPIAVEVLDLQQTYSIDRNPDVFLEMNRQRKITRELQRLGKRVYPNYQDEKVSASNEQ